MITRRDLASQARLIEARSFPLDVAVEAATTRLVGLQLRPRQRPRLWLPKGVRPSWVAPASSVAEAVLPGRGPGIVADVLTNHLRLYEVDDVAPARTIAVAGAYTDEAPGLGYLALGYLRAVAHGKNLLDCGSFELEFVDLGDSDSVQESLERLASGMVTQHLALGNPDDPYVRSATAVGGARGFPIAGWQRTLQAVLWPYGIRLQDVFEEPWRHVESVNRKLSTRLTDYNIFLRTWCVDSGGYDHTDEFIRLVDRRSAIDTEDATTFDDALILIRGALDAEHLVDPPPGVGPADDKPSGSEPRFTPESWKDVHENLWRLTSEHFVMTKRARRSCRANAYANYERMWEHLELLAEVAAAWVARVRKDGRLGEDFAAWAYELNGISIALFDKQIKDANEDTFSYGGKSHSRLPHVKVDDAKAFTEIGRIHFAIDPDNQRLIVDHVGLKLLGRRAAT
jgi:hypothetical protein